MEDVVVEVVESGKTLVTDRVLVVNGVEVVLWEKYSSRSNKSLAKCPLDLLYYVYLPRELSGIGASQQKRMVDRTQQVK